MPIKFHCIIYQQQPAPILQVQQPHIDQETLCIEWHKKMGTFEKPNKNWRNPRKKKLLTETEPLQLAF